MAVYLNENLRDFFSTIKLEYAYKDVYKIDFMDYFQLLKIGNTIPDTYYNIVACYGLKNNYAKSIRSVSDKIVRDIFNIYDGSGDDDFLLTAKEMDRHEVESLNDVLQKELRLSKLLLKFLNSKQISSDLLQLIILMKDLSKMNSGWNPKNELSELFDIMLNNSHVRVIHSVITNNTKDIVDLLYIEDFDPRIGNNVLYHLALYYQRKEIVEVIKEYSIFRNLYERQALTNVFYELIGPSDISDTLYSYMNTLLR